MISTDANDGVGAALPNWITAVAALGALAAAIGAGVTASRIHRLESARDAKRAEEERRAQAARVAAWVSWTDWPKLALEMPDGTFRRANLALRNNTHAPIYGIEVEYVVRGRHRGGQRYGLLSPTGDRAHHREIKSPEFMAFLAEHDERTRLDIRVIIGFTDATGARSQRGPDGQLSPVPEVAGMP